jgi:hypothetical protein
MKRILFIVAILAMFSIAASAQTVMVNPNGFSVDTASQAAAEGAKTLVLKGNIKTVGIVVKTLKISGTIAGTISWQASNNGVDFSTLSTTALVDASTNYNYKEVDKGYLYYKALITQTGTSSLSYQAVLYVPPIYQ